MAIPASLSEVKSHVKSKEEERKQTPKAEAQKQSNDQKATKSTPFDKGKVGAVLEDVVAHYKQQKRLIESTLLKQPFEVNETTVKFFLNGELQEHRFAQLRPELDTDG